MPLPSKQLDLEGRHALKLGNEIYLRYKRKKAIETRISGFLMFGESPDGPIVAVTGGAGEVGGDAITAAAGVTVGKILFAKRRLVFIKLDDDYRSYVENIVKSEKNLQCHPIIHEGAPLIGERVLAHTGDGRFLRLKIDGVYEDGWVQPLVNIGNTSLPLGSLLTKQQDRGEESSRLLPAFGPVSNHQMALGKRQAVITRLDVGLSDFRRETNDERYKANVVSFVTPIMQPEDEDAAAGTRDVDGDGGDDTDTSGLASEDSFASLSSADQAEGAVAAARGERNRDRAESGYGSRGNLN